MKISECNKCHLHKTRTQVVCGSGNKKTKIMFIGEAPGADEDLNGKPFVGRAGKVLDKALKKNKINREQIYITNVVKCRPPKNRDPFDYEKDSCKIWLLKELRMIKPVIIVTLGKHAFTSMKFLYKDSLAQITGSDGIDFVYGIFKNNKIKRVLIKAIHPAATLYNPKLITIFEQQINFVSQIKLNKVQL